MYGAIHFAALQHPSPTAHRLFRNCGSRRAHWARFGSADPHRSARLDHRYCRAGMPSKLMLSIGTHLLLKWLAGVAVLSVFVLPVRVLYEFIPAYSSESCCGETAPGWVRHNWVSGFSLTRLKARFPPQLRKAGFQRDVALVTGWLFRERRARSGGSVATSVGSWSGACAFCLQEMGVV